MLLFLQGDLCELEPTSWRRRRSASQHAAAMRSITASFFTPRRHFLNGLLRAGGGDRRRTQRWQRVVPHRAESIYHAVADVEHYSEFLPWCTSSRVVERADSALHTEVTVGYASVSSTFASRVELTPLQRVHAVSEPNEYIDHLSFTWEFAALNDHACRVEIGLDFSLRNAEHTLMWTLAEEKVISEYVRCFSQRCAALEAKQKT